MISNPLLWFVVGHDDSPSPIFGALVDAMCAAMAERDVALGRPDALPVSRGEHEAISAIYDVLGNERHEEEIYFGYKLEVVNPNRTLFDPPWRGKP